MQWYRTSLIYIVEITYARETIVILQQDCAVYKHKSIKS